MDVRIGARGPMVTAWQQFLNTRKITVDIDGIFGPKLQEATKLWQFRAGVPLTGAIDDATLTAAKTIGHFETFIAEKSVKISDETKLELFDGDTALERINNAKLAGVAPVMQRRGKLFIEAAKADGTDVQIVQGMRTFAEQNALYAIGRTKPGKKVTNAIGGSSNHNYGLALDFAPLVNGKVSWDEKLFKPFGGWAKEAGLEWGGDWRFVDLPHVQIDDLPAIAKIRAVYSKGGISAVWAAYGT